MRRKIHSQLQILEILHINSLMIVNALNYGICHLDSPFSKYGWSELVGQRQVVGLFHHRIFPPSDSKGWLSFHHRIFHHWIQKSGQAFIIGFFTLGFKRMVGISSLEKEQSNILRKLQNILRQGDNLGLKTINWRQPGKK